MVFTLGSSVGDDVKWRSAVERALGTWESVVEWADYISFLARVQKAIKNRHHCDGVELPLAPQISEMLARCLEPSLPAGVHQTCLDVYDTVFATLGAKKLAEDVNVWLPGLLPLVSRAAFNVKPVVVALFQKHIVPAAHGAELNELCRPLLLALLPSLEEETGDCFTEIMDLVVTIHRKLNNDLLFWQCMCLCVLTSGESRLGALTYFSKHQPHLDDLGLLVRAVCAGLDDGNVLVQRGFLDVLIKQLPLDSEAVQRSVDLPKLVLGACRTILRRDMSLNRRLWMWLLGPEPDEGPRLTRLEYFQKYAASTIVNILLEDLQKDSQSDKYVTYAIARGLMDRYELGATVAPALLKPMLEQAHSSGKVERGASQFFDNVEANVVWNTAIQLLSSGDSDTVLFMTTHFAINDPEMLKLHIPLVMVYIMCGEPNEDELEIVKNLTDVLKNQEIPAQPVPEFDGDELRSQIQQYYSDTLDAGLSGDDQRTTPINPRNASWYMVKYGAELFLNDKSPEILNGILRLLPSVPGLEFELPSTNRIISKLSADSGDDVELFTHIADRMTSAQKMRYVSLLVDSLTKTIQSGGKCKVERVHALWRVHESIGGAFVPSALSAVLADPLRAADERARFFSGLWIHSIEQSDITAMLTKPLLLFLDLEQEDPELFSVYLQSAVVRTGTSGKLLKLLTEKVDVEIQEGDAGVLGYVLRRFISVLGYKDVRRAYTTKYAPVVCTLLLEWFRKNELNAAYTPAIDLVQLTVLDNNVKDSKLWLKRFADTLIQHKFSGTLVRFMTACMPELDTHTDIGGFMETCVIHLDTEVDYECFESLLDAYLRTPVVAETLLHRVAAKLSTLDESLIHCHPADIGDADGVLHLVAVVEKIIASGIEADTPVQTSGLTLTGFQVESPEDRTRAEETHSALVRCLQVAITEACKYWLFLQRTRAASGLKRSSDYTTALHTTGRLKTRLRKLLALCYSAMPKETLECVAEEMDDINAAVRMTHMFEGPRYKATLELLLKLAVTPKMFEYAQTYVRSLERDVLGDVWQLIQSFLSSVSPSLPGALAFATDLAPRLEKSKLKSRKKVSREFADSFTRLLLATESESEVKEAIKQIPIVISEQDGQALVLSKVLSGAIKNPRDVPKATELLLVVTSVFSQPGSAPSKVWSRIVGEFLFETRTSEQLIPFTTAESLSLVPVVQAWAQSDKERVKEFVTKLPTYGSGTVLFGWSGTQELANENLRRLAYICAAAPPPFIALNWTKISGQLDALWPQNAASVCTLLRACMLSEPSPTILSLMTFKLQEVFREVLASSEPPSGYKAKVLVEASKLLDLALCAGADQFQLFEWLFIVDSTEAIYSYDAAKSRAGSLIDKLARAAPIPKTTATEQAVAATATYKGLRRPLLPKKAQLVDLHAFFSQLSITAYEEVYAMTTVDSAYCLEWLFADLFS